MSLAVHRFAELFADSESGNAFRRNLQRFVCLGIATGASSALTCFECAEADKSNSFARGNSLHNGLHHHVDDCFCVFLGGAGFARDNINQFCFIQDASTPSYAHYTEIPFVMKHLVTCAAAGAGLQDYTRLPDDYEFAHASIKSWAIKPLHFGLNREFINACLAPTDCRFGPKRCMG
jgi:hypothetical protein